MYSTTEEVRRMLSDDALNTLIGSDDYIEDLEEREEKILPIIEEAIADADGEIDGYLNKRYPVPLQRVPKAVNKFSKDIAIYNLYSRIGIDEGERENNYLTRYKNAIRFLENIAKGLIDLGVQSPVQQSGNNGFNVSSSPRLFKRSSMRGM